jgi:hypothetical protein
MNAADSSQIVLNADPEHSGVRIAVMAALVVTFIASFAILAMIIRSFEESLVSDFYFILSCAGAMALSIGAAGLSEYYTKSRWLSGRSLLINKQGMITTEKDGEKAYFTWDGHMSLVKWYIHLSGYRKGGRERRVQSDWYCVSCQVQQDEDRFVAYTYMPEEKAGQFFDDKRFLQLRPGEFEQNSMLRRWLTPPKRPNIPTKVLAGKQGHFWLAERRRWSDGMEFEIDDFFVILNELDRRVVD